GCIGVDDSVGNPAGGKSSCTSQGVGGFDGWHNAFGSREPFESVHGFGIADRLVYSAASIVQESVLRSNTGVILSGCYRVGIDGLTTYVLHQVGLCAVEDVDAAQCNGCGVFAGIDPSSTGFHAVQGNILVIEEAVEEANGA